GDEDFSADEVAEQKSASKRKLIILVVTLFMSLVIIVGGYFGYNYYVKSGAKMPFSDGVNLDVFKSEEETTTTPEGEANVNQIPDNEDVQNSQENNTPVDISAVGQGPLDTDGDGISDQDETVRGMDLNNPDSDSDGLFDREEVMVYNTDPIVSDTDGDGFSDGDEVKGGYNPLGTGKLYDINQVK
ncbi:MAG: hypothetical protein Q7T50_00355, partial [Candidatus Magasanikbacteria bacterium]|nr:hypothetical protein [Candidatus Magasanikbacteria bacterium]